MTKPIHQQLLECAREILVVRIDPRIVHSRRVSSHAKELRIRFRIAADSDLPVHHIVPLALGGRNSMDNFACVARELHEHIHDFIDAQGELEVGQRATRLIPFMRGKVWQL